jgi:hypothetical protein
MKKFMHRTPVGLCCKPNSPIFTRRACVCFCVVEINGLLPQNPDASDKNIDFENKLQTWSMLISSLKK